MLARIIFGGDMIKGKLQKLFGILIITFIGLIPFYNTYGMMRGIPVSEIIRKSKYIIVGKCVNISSEIYDLEYRYFPGKLCHGNHYGYYIISQVLKGDIYDSIFTVDYLKTNEKYPPFGCVIEYPKDGLLWFQPKLGEEVILFVEEDRSLYCGSWGRVAYSDSLADLYEETINFLDIIDKLERQEKFKLTVAHLDDDNPFIRWSMGGDLHAFPLEIYGRDIIKLLDSENPGIRNVALDCLRGITDTTAVSPVLPLLADSSSAVRYQAIEILAHITDPRIEPALIRAYNDPVSRNRDEIIFALHSKRCLEAESLYLKALEDTNFYVRRSGVYAMSLVKSPQKEKALLRYLNREDSLLQNTTPNPLFFYDHSPEIIGTVSEFLTNPDENLRKASINCIYNYSKKDHLDFDKKSFLKSKLLDLALGNNDPGLRSKAIYTLEEAKAPQLSSYLPQFLADSSWQIRQTAADLMGKSGKEDYIPLLNEALQTETNTNVTLEIEKALAVLKGN